MKKLLLTCCLLSLSFSVFALPGLNTSGSDTENSFSAELKSRMAEERFMELYNTIDYGTGEKPQYEVFRKAFIGYLNLKKENKLSKPDILSCIDFSLPSTQERLWIIDLKNKKVLFHELVAHGKNSGGNMATTFSNIMNSNMSSLGFYVTAQKYTGKHGLSLRLSGQEAGYNDMAMARAVVIHGADYVSKEFVKSMGRLGRSFGCPAVSREVSDGVINAIADGSCVFIYYPDNGYLQKSALLNEMRAIDYLLATEGAPELNEQEEIVSAL